MSLHTNYELSDEVQVKYPKKYKVFMATGSGKTKVLSLLLAWSFFHKSYEEAENIMLEVHKKERGLCGTYTQEIAETKVLQVIKKAQDNGFPLKATMEEE